MKKGNINPRLTAEENLFTKNNYKSDRIYWIIYFSLFPEERVKG
jgi:hypothetical protein